MRNFERTLFHPLEEVDGIVLPKQFTFPFYYTPHSLCITAAKAVQNYLETQTNFTHNFGLDSKQTGLQIGKMFGVMVVKNTAGELGYLTAFSGKLAESNFIKGFVPTVYDTLRPDGFYKKGEARLNSLNKLITDLEQANELDDLRAKVMHYEASYKEELKAFKAELKSKKKARKARREAAFGVLSTLDYEALLEDLKQQSIYYHFRLKDLKTDWELKLKAANKALDALVAPIEALKLERATLSSALQNRLHEQYRFLNAKGETKDLLAIFKPTVTPTPPAGSGECAAPKLFQYAYEHDLKPIAMAEFWWGASPKSEVRQHKQFYPSCRSKCEPILGHMMQGLDVEDNPIQQQVVKDVHLDIVYEDDYLLVVNKPHEVLSVPGKYITASVLTKMRRYLPKAKGPLLVHRLDMSTSGLLLVAKNEKTHKNLQKQFMARTVKKRYVALLDGVLETASGEVELPLRVDLDNRPQQLVCYEHGKLAKTLFETIGIENGKTRVYFYPVTGRTHQLRVHAAHASGLNAPIVGDDLYGTKAERLHLHAESLQFTHPVTLEPLHITCKTPF